MISAVQRDRVQGHIDAGPAEGANPVYSGRRPTDPALANGFAGDLRGHQRHPARTQGDLRPGGGHDPVQRCRRVVRLANDTEYGPVAAIWSRDIGLALRTAKAVKAGVVWANDSQPASSEAMWGGYKQSGIGRELGPHALDVYLESKQIYINLA